MGLGLRAVTGVVGGLLSMKIGSEAELVLEDLFGPGKRLCGSKTSLAGDDRCLLGGVLGGRNLGDDKGASLGPVLSFTSTD